MPRFAIDLTEQTHRALKKAAAYEGRSIGVLIEERPASDRGLSVARAREIVARA